MTRPPKKWLIHTILFLVAFDIVSAALLVVLLIQAAKLNIHP